MMHSKRFSSVTNAICVLFLCMGSLASDDATAAVVSPSASVTVTKSYAYTDFNGGDFVFSTSATAPGCGGGWYISAADPGYKSAVATVQTAQAGGNYLLVSGDNTDLWSGSSGQYCHVRAVGITS